MKLVVSQKPWKKEVKKVARVVYALLIVLQSILVGPMVTHADSNQGPATVTLLAQRDATISSNQAGVNFGASNLLSVTTDDATGVKMYNDTLIWFDTSTVPVGATIVSAQVTVVQEDSSGSGNYPVEAQAIMSEWEENTVTWDLKPLSASQGDAALMVGSGGGIRSWDVTKIVQAWANSVMPNNGILLQASDDSVGGRFFTSREDSAHAPLLTVNYELGDAPVLQIGDAPLETHRFAAQLLAEMRGTPMAPGWENAELSPDVRPLYRPDIDAIAYYEFQVIRPQEAAVAAGLDEAAGFIIVSATDLDYPIAHWGFEALPPSRKLDELAHADGKVAYKTYKLDTLSYVAEDIAGNMVASLGEIPANLTGMDPAWLDQPMQLAHTMPSEPSTGADGVFHAGAQLLTGATPPQSIKISEWESWQALKSGYSGAFAVLAEDLHRHALKEWTIDRRANEIGEGLRKGDLYMVGLLSLPAPVVSASGPGTNYIQSQEVNTNGKLSGFLITVTGAEKDNAVPFQVDVQYSNGVTETIKFRILQEQSYHQFMPLLSSDSAAVSDSQMASAASVHEVQNMYSWTYYDAGNPSDERRYKQIAKHTGPNKGNCYSGCGPTAWAMLFGWVDYRASLQDPKWKDRFGIYRWNGTRWGGDVVAPASIDAGIMNIIMEINWQVGTFCVWGQGATLPWDMDQVTDYLDGRSGAVIGTDYNVLGFHTDNMYDEVTHAISRRQTPVIIGTGWLSSAHYPVAHGFAWRMRRVDGEDEVQKMLLVNQGQGGAKSEWIHEGSFFVGNIWPCFEVAYGQPKCFVTPRDAN